MYKVVMFDRELFFEKSQRIPRSIICFPEEFMVEMVWGQLILSRDILQLDDIDRDFSLIDFHEDTLLEVFNKKYCSRFADIWNN